MISLTKPGMRVSHAAASTSRVPTSCSALPSGNSDKSFFHQSFAAVGRALPVAVILSAATAAVPMALGGGPGGRGVGRGGGGGGGGNWDIVESLFAAKAEEDEDEDEEDDYEDGDDEDGEDALNDEEGVEDGDRAASSKDDDDDDDEYVDTREGFQCFEVVADGLPTAAGVPTEEELFANLKCQPGFNCTRKELSEDLKQLLQYGLFRNVTASVTPLKRSGGKCRLTFHFTKQVWKPITSIKVEGSKLLPADTAERATKLLPPGNTDLRHLAAIKSVVEGWYQENGYPFSYIKDWKGLDTGEVSVEVVEAKVAKIGVVHVDGNGQVVSDKAKINIPDDVVLRELPISRGMYYNYEDGRRALRDVFALQLFDNVQVVPTLNPKDEQKIDVEVMVKERPPKTAELDVEWQLAQNDRGLPVLASLSPGGTWTFEDRNMGRSGQTFGISINTSNFLAPDDMSYRLSYKHPYYFGSDDPNKTALHLDAFNTRKLSGVFTAGPMSDDVPEVWVDRTGLKVGLQESYTCNSKGFLGLCAQQVTTRDDNNALCTHGTQGGGAAAEGPPTTLSGTGMDRSVYLQGTLVRDATYLVNNTPVGARDVVSVEQGLGLGALQNKHVFSATRFLQLRPVVAGQTTTPPVLVAHGRYSGCVGDQASYDLFTLGGPHSVRGFWVGELGACRRALEAAVEMRVNAPFINKQVYAFWEKGTDLGSAKEVTGNPTEYYRKAGSGSSMGVGLKMGAVRGELTRDLNMGKTHAYVLFGERF